MSMLVAAFKPALPASRRMPYTAMTPGSLHGLTNKKCTVFMMFKISVHTFKLIILGFFKIVSKLKSANNNLTTPIEVLHSTDIL
jgi:hypothetical protein